MTAKLKNEDPAKALDAAKPKGGPDRAKRLGRPQKVKSLALIKKSTKDAYYECYRDIFAEGALDRRVKELIAIGAASVTGCQGCLMGHIRKARALGITTDEIKEAVGVAFSVNAATVVDHTDVVAAMLNLSDDDSESEEETEAE